MSTDKLNLIEGRDYLVEGNVLGWDHQPVKMRNLIKRWWGWPKTAAQMAADHLRKQPGAPILWLEEGMRDRQRVKLFESLQELPAALCRGLAYGSTKEVKDQERWLDEITIRFSTPVQDDGTVSLILRALANRFGTTVEEMRFATHFSSKSSLHRAFIADGKAELVRNIEGITLTVGKMVDP